MGRKKCSEANNLNLKRGTSRFLQNAPRGQHASSKTGFDGVNEAPWRKTLSIFKQPVTLVHTTSRHTQKTPADIQKRLNSSTSHRSDFVEKPKQVFWAKALEGLTAMLPIRDVSEFNPNAEDCIEQSLILPPKIEPILNPLKEQAASATLIASIHHSPSNDVLTGQQSTKKQIEDNPFSALSFSQPFVQISAITEQDISAQEKKVIDARKRLSELRKSFLITI